MSAPSVHIVETTLRDGSYEVDFQFTPEDTAFFASKLERAGFGLIEVCHGVGFGAELWGSPPKLVAAAASDVAHLEAAASVLTRAKLGVIMVVGEGFTPPSALATLKRLGVSFVRLAYLPDTIYDPSCLAYIDEAKRQGLTVSINLMQTYALSPSEVAGTAKETSRRGAEWFYIVDSAGGMTTHEVAEYVRAIRETTPLRVGMHAHNNSAMAMANCLAAVEAGATLLDSTLQGIGRATGNPSTEQLLLALQRLGHETHVDREAVLALGELARPLFAERGADPMHFVSGNARMHSRYLARFGAEAKLRAVGPRELVYQLGRVARARGVWNGETFAPEIFDEAIAAIRKGEVQAESPALVTAVADGLVRVSTPAVDAACANLFARAHKNRKRSVLHLVPRGAYPFSGPLPWETGDLCGISVGVDALAAAPPKGLRAPHFVMHDPDLAPPAEWLPQVPRFAEPFRPIVADAIATLVTSLAATQVVVGELGDAALTEQVAQRLREQGRPASAQRTPGAAVLVLHADRPWPALEPGDVVIAAAGGRSAQIDGAKQRGIRVLRPPLQAALAARALVRTQVIDRLRAGDAPAGGVVDPLIAASATEIVIDDLAALNHIVDARALADAARSVAPLRIAALNRGRGRI